MQGPCFAINKCRTTTIITATTTDNDIHQHEPAEKGAECQMSDPGSIDNEVSEGPGAWG